MSKLINRTMNDLRSGRESWRVVALLSAISFTLAVAGVAMAPPF